MSASIYKMELLDSGRNLIKELDYFILTSGSDSRAYEVLSRIDTGNKSKTKVILLHFEERLRERRKRDPIFKYKTFSIAHLQEATCEIKRPSSSLGPLQLNTFDVSNEIGIDISCFTKPYFYFLIKLLRERFGIQKISAYYTEPQSYKFPRGIFTDFRTSAGPLSIIEIPGYSGQESRDSLRKLIILLGFDGDLSREINEDVSPSETFLVNGFPSYSPKFKDISLIANEKLVSDRNIKVMYARANHPFEVYNLLSGLKHQVLSVSGQEAFFNIAPLGTKPMALGACLFALHNPDVRVVYPLPETYEDKYSENCWNSWMYELPLS
jgi:hypothetical protein